LIFYVLADLLSNESILQMNKYKREHQLKNFLQQYKDWLCICSYKIKQEVRRYISSYDLMRSKNILCRS